MYFLSLNGVMIASLGPSERIYNHSITLQRDMEYTYSVVAISCAGNSTPGVKSISIESELYLSHKLFSLSNRSHLLSVFCQYI